MQQHMWIKTECRLCPGHNINVSRAWLGSHTFIHYGYMYIFVLLVWSTLEEGGCTICTHRHRHPSWQTSAMLWQRAPSCMFRYMLVLLSLFLSVYFVNVCLLISKQCLVKLYWWMLHLCQVVHLWVVVVVVVCVNVRVCVCVCEWVCVRVCRHV